MFSDNIEYYMPKTTVTLYHASWCGHCVHFLPEWKQFKELIKSKGLNIKTLEFEESSNRSEIARAGIEGFPTIRISKDDDIEDYSGPRTADALLEEVNKQKVGGSKSKSKTLKRGGAEPFEYTGEKTAKALIDKVHSSKKTKTGGKFRVILFTSANCTHCEKFIPEWKKFKALLKEKDLDVTVEEYSKQKDPEVIDDHKIIAFPTIKIVYSDGTEYEYPGKRTAEKLLEEVEDDVQFGRPLAISGKKKKCAVKKDDSSSDDDDKQHGGNLNDDIYYSKYMKYKQKYLKLKSRK
jgi:thiol-disulfide isomerase/thioredoxin